MPPSEEEQEMRGNKALALVAEMLVLMQSVTGSVMPVKRLLTLIGLWLLLNGLICAQTSVPVPPCQGQRWICSNLAACISPIDCQLGAIARSEVHCSQVGTICCLYILHIYECVCSSSGSRCGNAGISTVFWWANGICGPPPTPMCIY